MPPTADPAFVPVSELTDLELVEGVRKGSEAHFNQLYERYFPRIFNFTFSRVRNRADAEEITQETFTAVFRSIEAFQGKSALLTWIFGIARNTINNHLRRARIHDERVDAAEPEMIHPINSLALTTPEEQLALRRHVEAIEDRLESVSRWQVDVFMLRHLENLSIREIADRMKRTDDAIRSSLYRVKRLLVDTVNSPTAPRSHEEQQAWSAV